MGYRSSTSQGFATTTPWTVTKPAGTADGDQMLVCLGHGAGGSVNSVPAGWTLDSGPHAVGGQTVRIYRKVASGEGASWAWGFTSGVTGIAQAVSVSDVDAIAPMNITGFQVNAASVNVVAPSVTTTAAGCTLVGFFYSQAAGGSYTVPGGMTEVQDQAQGSNAMETAHQLLGAAGATGTRTAVCTVANANIGYLAAIAPFVVSSGASLLVAFP